MSGMDREEGSMNYWMCDTVWYPIVSLISDRWLEHLHLHIGTVVTCIQLLHPDDMSSVVLMRNIMNFIESRSHEHSIVYNK